MTLKQGDIQRIEELESELRHVRGALDQDPDDQIKEHLRDFLVAVTEQVENGRLSTDEPRYEHYLTEFISETPRAAPTKSALELADFDAEEDDVDIRFAAYFTALLCTLRNPNHDFGDLTRTLENFREEFDDPIIDYLKLRVYRDGFTTEHYEIAILAGVAAAEQVSENEFVYSNLSGAIVDFVYSTSEITIDSEAVPDDREALLDFAHKHAQRSIYLAEDEPGLHAVFGNVLLLQERYDEAEDQLQQAIRKELDRLSGRVIGGVTSTDSYRQQLRDIRRSRHQAESAQRSMDRLDDNVSDYTEGFEDTVQRYRDQSLQFIGFFAAIVAVVLVSAQVVTNVESFDLASRLILVLIGGLLTAFSGLGMILERKFSIYHLAAAIMGGILILGGWLLSLI